MNIKELNELRCTLAKRIQVLGMMGEPSDPSERLRADAIYKMTQDAWLKAETDYQRAISTLSAKELIDTINVLGVAETGV